MSLLETSSFILNPLWKRNVAFNQLCLLMKLALIGGKLYASESNAISVSV